MKKLIIIIGLLLLASVGMAEINVVSTPALVYTLPTATSSVLGGVKPDGTSILNTAGAISVTPASIGAVPYTGATADVDLGSYSIYSPIPVVIATDGLAMTAKQCSGTSLNNYGQGASITVTLPAAASGLNCLPIVGTQYNGVYKIQRAGADTIIADGVAGKTYVTETNQSVGSEIACRTLKTGASAWTWKCTTISGTWTTD